MSFSLLLLLLIIVKSLFKESPIKELVLLLKFSNLLIIADKSSFNKELVSLIKASLSKVLALIIRELVLLFFIIFSFFSIFFIFCWDLSLFLIFFFIELLGRYSIVLGRNLGLLLNIIGRVLIVLGINTPKKIDFWVELIIFFPFSFLK